MKRLIALLMALVMCLTLCACGVDEEKVKEELEGVWEYSWYATAVGFECSVVYQFGDNGSMIKTNVRNGEETVNYGYYIVTNDVIEIYYAGESEIQAELTYKYKDGVLSLNDGEYTKIK